MIKKSQLIKDYYKPGEVAKMLNVTTRTIQNYCIDGRLIDEVGETGRRLISKESIYNYAITNNLLEDDTDDFKQDLIYARVNGLEQKQRGDLDLQIAQMSKLVAYENPKDLEVIVDVNESWIAMREGLNLLIKKVLDNKVNRVFIAEDAIWDDKAFDFLHPMFEYMGVKLIVLDLSDGCSFKI